MDFWDRDGEGWDVLKWVPLDHGDQSTAEVEAILTFLLWLIRLSAPDIEANYDTESVFELILRAHPGIADAVGLLLDLGPPGAIDKLQRTSTFFDSPGAMKTFAGEGITLLCYLTILQQWDHVHTLLALGANPHQVCLNTHFSPVTESPLSLAMYSSWKFWAFRNALHRVGLNTEDIAHRALKQRCPLLETGWRMETLSALLELEFKPDFEPYFEPLRPHMNYYCCDCCDSYIVHVEVQPYWLHILENIKNGISPQMMSSDTLDEQSPNGQSNLTMSNKNTLLSIKAGNDSSHDFAFSKSQITQPDKQSLPSDIDRREVWCIWCWYYYKDNGHRRPVTSVNTQDSDGGDSSDDDFSPFLFNS